VTGAAAAEGALVVVADRLHKRFFNIQALDDVSFDLRAGEVHAVVGENGAGKSTLIKVLTGIHQPDSGRILIDGRARRFRDPHEALAAGLAVIPQELRLVPALSVAENVLLGHLPHRRVLGMLPLVDRQAVRARAREALGRLGLAATLDTRVGTLPYAEQQLVAIARALSRRVRVLVLDEPTAALEAREVRRLFETVAALKAGGVGIVYISHRLEEVIELADRCTVLRDGRVIAVRPRGALDLAVLVRDMTGRDVEHAHRRAERPAGPTVLAASIGREHEASAHVTIGAGEVVGLAGLLGSGTGRLLRRLFGAEPALVLELRGRPTVVRRPSDAIRSGIGMVPGERAKGLVLTASVRDNILLPVFDRVGRGPGGRLWLDRARADAVVRQLMDALDIRPRDPDRIVRYLSGGNQQKVVFARWLATRAAILLLEEPTQGIDVAAKAQIHRLIREFAERGGGVLLASADLNEVLSESDSVLAMKQGAIVARLGQGEQRSERELRAVLGTEP